jgi:hypothetical protein
LLCCYVAQAGLELVDSSDPPPPPLISAYQVADTIDVHDPWGAIFKEKKRIFPRWWLEGGNRKHASYSEILDRCWRHTLQAKPPRRDKTLIPPHL